MNSVGPETKFQVRERLYEVWENNGGAGEPPELPVFRSTEHGISAMVDPFSAWDLGVVIYPHEAARGEEAHLWELPPSRYMKLQLVAQAVGNRILKVVRDQEAAREGETTMPHTRALARVDGFALPDHPHIVLGAAERGASPLKLPEDGGRTAELNRRWVLLRLPEPARQHLIESLGLVDNSAPIMDALFYRQRMYEGVEAEYPAVPTVHDLSRLLTEADEVLQHLDAQSDIASVAGDEEGYCAALKQQATLIAGLAGRLAAYQSAGGCAPHELQSFIVMHSARARAALNKDRAPYYTGLNFSPWGSTVDELNSLQKWALRLQSGEPD